MAESQSDDIGRKDKINILFKEYDTLRAEILNRMNHRWQMAGVIGAILAFIGSQGGFVWRVLLFIIATGAIVTLWIIVGQYVGKLTDRIIEIEHRINDLAGSEKLLRWETDRKNTLRRLLGM